VRRASLRRSLLVVVVFLHARIRAEPRLPIHVADIYPALLTRTSFAGVQTPIARIHLAVRRAEPLRSVTNFRSEHYPAVRAFSRGSIRVFLRDVPGAVPFLITGPTPRPRT
jgi:hypothetical protein